MNPTPQATAVEIRHRILEGVLLRLARLPEADEFILRGGMLLRHWFRPHPRPADDLDLVSRGAFSVEAMTRRLVPLLAEQGVDDGVTFDSRRVRVEGIWMNTAYPGVRMFASGSVDDIEDEFTVDVTFGEPLVPLPTRNEYPMRSVDRSAHLWMCRPETILGRKLHALMHAGLLHWRPKDLNDVHLLLSHVPLDVAELPEAIAASFLSRGNTTADARSLFGKDAWWGTKMSTARWLDFVEECPEQGISRDLAGVVADVAERLQPILERLP